MSFSQSQAARIARDVERAIAQRERFGLPCFGHTLTGTPLSLNGRREMARAVRVGVVSGDTGVMHGPRRHNRYPRPLA